MMCIKMLSNSLANQIYYDAFKTKSQTELENAVEGKCNIFKVH